MTPGHEAPARPARIDPATALTAAVVLLALAGIGALLADHLVHGALRLAAGVLTGAGVAAALLAVPVDRVPRLARRGRLLLAAGVALVIAAALTVPAVLATRIDPLEDRATATLAPLAQGDAVHSLPAPDSPVLVRRADGTAQVVIDGRVRTIEAGTHDVLALSADGTRLLRATGASTEVLLLDVTASAPDGGFPSQRFEGTPLALDGDRLLLRRCAEGFCRVVGYDLTAPEEPLWQVSAPAETRGTDPVGIEVPARAEEPSGLLDAVRATGVLPSIPLSYDPSQGWVQLDPSTGFPVGRILAGPEETCRIAATTVVLTLCSDEDGSMTATAFRDGEELWTSDPSPAGTWQVRLDHGRVIASGTEAGSEATGEIIATEQRADWTGPGGQGVAEAAEFTSRIGLDGTQMVVTNASGQLVAYALADGAHRWTLPLTFPGTPVRGTMAEGTAVVLDLLERERPLQPRDAQRLRVIDADTGAVTFRAQVAGEVGAVHAVGGGRALVTVDGQALLLGP